MTGHRATCWECSCGGLGGPGRLQGTLDPDVHATHRRSPAPFWTLPGRLSGSTAAAEAKRPSQPRPSACTPVGSSSAEHPGQQPGRGQSVHRLVPQGPPQGGEETGQALGIAVRAPGLPGFCTGITMSPGFPGRCSVTPPPAELCHMRESPGEGRKTIHRVAQ